MGEYGHVWLSIDVRYCTILVVISVVASSYFEFGGG